MRCSNVTYTKERRTALSVTRFNQYLPLCIFSWDSFRVFRHSSVLCSRTRLYCAICCISVLGRRVVLSRTLLLALVIPLCLMFESRPDSSCESEVPIQHPTWLDLVAFVSIHVPRLFISGQTGLARRLQIASPTSNKVEICMAMGLPRVKKSWWFPASLTTRHNGA